MSIIKLFTQILRIQKRKEKKNEAHSKNDYPYEY